MQNSSEVVTVKPRQQLLGLLAVLSFGATVVCTSAANAQEQTLLPRQTPGPKFMVPVFKSNERGLGASFADQLRSRLQGDFPGRVLWIVPKSDVDNSLEQSGYSRSEALTSNDTKQLANLVRAEEYIEGAINRTASGYEFEGAYLLVRGDGMVQPLAKMSNAKLGDLAKAVSNALDQARKPVEEVKGCMLKARQNKYADAMGDAQKGLKSMPNSVMARVCQLELAKSQNFGADSIIRIGEEIAKLNPGNRRALVLLADAYQEKKLDEKYIGTMTTLLAADPTNVRLVENVVNAIAATKQYAVAKPIIEEAVKQSPGDPALIRLQWRIYLATQEYKSAAAVGEEMIRSDTAMADTTFFSLLAGAYISAADTAKALEAASRGTAKFPNHVELWQIVGQLARQTGQMPVALNAYEKVASINPKQPGIQLQIANILSAQGAYDSSLARLRIAADAGEDKKTVGALVSSIASRMFNDYQKTKTVADAEKLLGILKYSESLDKTPTVYFLTGATSMVYGFTMMQEAQEAKSCEKAKKAEELMADAQINLPRGGQQFAQQLTGMMQQLQQYSSVPEQMKKQYCK